MFARLGQEEIDRHFTYALTIVQANVHVRDLIEKASMGMRNCPFLPLRVFLLRKECVLDIISREWDGDTLLPGFLEWHADKAEHSSEPLPKGAILVEEPDLIPLPQHRPNTAIRSSTH